MTDFEMRVGLEVHAELLTRTKIYCSCKTAYGAPPNTQCCPVCMGLPGALPMLNREAVRLAVKAGLATHCKIALRSGQDRKNYFYPDLPKAYQISQFDRPLCYGGYLEIGEGEESRRIAIERIHIEEDAGKLIHTEDGTLADYNRCGVPLIEIVSAPEIASAEEAVAYLRELREILLFLGISDCRMNEGSLRCDVNLSVRPRGQKEMGTRTEIKNLNSVAFMAEAIAYEEKRQTELLRSGGRVVRETRRFDEKRGITLPMRSKEDAEDYRFFPDPDLGEVRIPEEEVEALRVGLPMLPRERRRLYVSEMGLTPYAASQMTANPAICQYFEMSASQTEHKKLLSDFLMTEVLRLSCDGAFTCPISPEHLGALVEMMGEQKINHATAKKLLPELWESDADPCALVRERGLLVINDAEELRRIAEEVIEEDLRAASDYRSGKPSALGALVGRAMAKTEGRANAKLLREEIVRLLEK